MFDVCFLKKKTWIKCEKWKFYVILTDSLIYSHI